MDLAWALMEEYDLDAVGRRTTVSQAKEGGQDARGVSVQCERTSLPEQQLVEVGSSGK